MRLHTVGAWWLAAGSLLAQPEPATPPGQEPEPPRQEYTGPAILSRGLGALTAADRELLRLRPFASVHGSYDTGLTPLSVNQAGQVPSDDGYGVDANFGLTGYHSWRQSVLGMQYQGRVRRYSRQSYYNAFDNYLIMSVVHRASRRVTLEVAPAMASLSHGYFAPQMGSAYYSPELAALTESELFDSRVNVVMGSGRLIYQRTARLSFSAGANGFTTHRQSRALTGVTGYSSMGDVAYRVGRYQTIGVDYSFMHYDYQRVYGDTDAHGIGVNYAVQVGPDWTLSLRVGGYRVEISRLERVPLDPVIAAIIGQTTAITTDYRKLFSPALGGHLARRYRRGMLTIDYVRSLNPGNGLYLTSSMERGGAGASYRGTERASFHAFVSAHQYRALIQSLGHYRAYWGGVGMNYKLGRDLALSFTVGARHYEVRNTPLDRVSYRASLGLTYSPGELPFSLW